MAPFITLIVFVFGIAIATFSALMVAMKKKSKLWYAVPSVYTLLVMVTFATINGYGVDIPAVPFFAASLTVLGWAIVRYEVMRH